MAETKKKRVVKNGVSDRAFPDSIRTDSGLSKREYIATAVLVGLVTGTPIVGVSTVQLALNLTDLLLTEERASRYDVIGVDPTEAE